jgi:hypothetical protein
MRLAEDSTTCERLRRNSPDADYDMTCRVAATTEQSVQQMQPANTSKDVTNVMHKRDATQAHTAHATKIYSYNLRPVHVLTESESVLFYEVENGALFILQFARLHNARRQRLMAFQA